MVDRYAQWSASPAASALHAHSVVPGSEDALRAAQFHVLADAVLPAWRWLGGDGSPPGAADGRRSQLLLAMRAAELMQRRRDRGVLVGTGPRSVVGTHEDDSVTRADTALTLLEIVRARPGAVVVPAPPQFQAGAPGTAVDLLVLDPAARAVNGIRAVTGLTRSERARQNHREGVQLIDGAADLANERLVPLHPGASSKALAPWPGLVSGHFLLRADSRRELFLPWRAHIERWQRLLDDELRGTADPLPRAVLRLRDRVLAPLGPRPL